MFKEVGAFLGAAAGFFLGNDILTKYIVEPNPGLQSKEGAFLFGYRGQIGHTNYFRPFGNVCWRSNAEIL